MLLLMEKTGNQTNETTETDVKKIAELFTLLIQIDQKQKEKQNDRHY